MNKLLVIGLLCVLLTDCLPVKRSFRVYHGDRLTSWSENKFKFVVGLFGDSICSASIYSQKFLISAGHCFQGEGKLSEALFAAVNLFDKTDKRIKIKKAYVRSDFNKNLEKNKISGRDISVVELVEDIPIQKFDVTIGTFRLYTRPKVGAIITIIGYGLDSHRNLNAGHFNQGKMKRIKCNENDFEGKPLCLSLEEKFNRQQNEGGDSGGPAVVFSKGEWAVVGVSSGYFNYLDGSRVAIYACIAANRKHIEKHTTITQDVSTE